MTAKLDLAQFQGYTPGPWLFNNERVTAQGEVLCFTSDKNGPIIAAAPAILAYARELENENRNLRALVAPPSADLTPYVATFPPASPEMANLLAYARDLEARNALAAERQAKLATAVPPALHPRDTAQKNLPPLRPNHARRCRARRLPRPRLPGGEMIYATLAKIRAHSPCKDGWAKLLKHLGKTKADNARLSLAVICRSNGLPDALWCLRACDGIGIFARRFALDCARSVEHLNDDPRVKACNDTVERFLAGEATKNELAAAWAAAKAAAWAAAGDDAGAAKAAAWAAAKAAGATWDAAGAAAWDASAAARSAAGDAAGDAAGNALQKHFLACLKSWPSGKWPKPPKLGKRKP